MTSSTTVSTTSATFDQENISHLPPTPNDLFVSCSFFFVGFESDEKDANYATLSSSGGNISGNSRKRSSPTTTRQNTGNSSTKLKHELQRLIRRGMGTIYWTVHESITHVVVADGIGSKLRNDVSNFCKYHPNNPRTISPQWVINSLKEQFLLDPSNYPPIILEKKKESNKKKNHQSYSNNKNNNVDTKRNVEGKDDNKDIIDTVHDSQENNHQDQHGENDLLLFQGAIFHLVSSEHNEINDAKKDQVTFDPTSIETSIINNGGHLLSQEVLNIIQSEENAMNNNKTKTTTSTSNIENNHNNDIDFICYVMNLRGPFNIQTVINNSPLLSKLHQSKICTLIPVTPIWMESCLFNETIYQPEEHPILFQPQKYVMYKIIIESNNNNNNMPIKISVSGFQNLAERSGLKFMIEAIGATYTDNMGMKNTHLICKEAKGPKYHKAIEWGLHVVTVDWLYHIVRYGYYGKDGSGGGSNTDFDRKKGCEKKFALTFSPRRVQPVSKRIDGDTVRPSKEFEPKRKEPKTKR